MKVTVPLGFLWVAGAILAVLVAYLVLLEAILRTITNCLPRIKR